MNFKNPFAVFFISSLLFYCRCCEGDGGSPNPSGVVTDDPGGSGSGGACGCSKDDPNGCGGSCGDPCGCGGKDDGKLKVVISFESLNPQSQAFFTSQVTPIYEEISKCVDFHFIPCSTSKIVQDVLQCADGVGECDIDVLHACAAHIYENDEHNLGKFFICMMTAKDQSKKGEECANNSGLDWNKLNACIPSKDAGEWCDNRYKQLNELKEPCVPGVLYNWKYDQQADQESVKDLKGGICDQIKKNNMQCAACDNCGGGNSVPADQSGAAPAPESLDSKNGEPVLDSNQSNEAAPTEDPSSGSNPNPGSNTNSPP